MSRLHRWAYWVFALDFTLLLLCLLGTYRATRRGAVPFDFESAEGVVVVGSLQHPSSPVAWQPGDTILACDGIPVASARDIDFLVAGRSVGASVPFRVRSHGLESTRAVLLETYYGTFYLVVQLVVGLLFFILGVFVLAMRSQEISAVIFHCESILVAVMVFSTPNRLDGRLSGLSFALDILYAAAGAFLPTLLAHFSLVFPRPKWPRLRRWLPVVYLGAAMLTVWMSATFLRATLDTSLEWLHRFELGYTVSRFYFVGCIAFLLYSLAHSYRTAVEEAERRQLRWVMLGLNLGPPMFVAWQMSELFGTHGWVREEYMHIVLSLVPITFAIAIIRYRLMNIDLIFRRSTVYAVTLGALLALYALLIGSTAGLFENLGIVPAITSGGAAILVALLFEPLRRSVQRLVDRVFFRVQYNLRQALRQLSNMIAQAMDVPGMAHAVVNGTERFLPVERIGFFTLEQPGLHLHLLAHHNMERIQTHGVHLDEDRMRTLVRLPMALEDQLEPGVPFSRVDPDALNRWNVALVFPIQSKEGQPLGFFALGPKKSGARFSEEDVELLASVAAQSGLAIERIGLQAALLVKQAEAQRLEELNRIKSYFVSSVSHDLKTPLTAIKMFAELLHANENIAPAEREEYFQIIEGESERLTRLINNVLDFARVEQGVKEYHFARIEVNDAVKQVMRSFRYPFSLHGCELASGLCAEPLRVWADADAFCECLQNLLSNALKYSPQSQVVTVTTVRDNSHAVIRVADQGEGISAEDLPHIFEPFYRGRHGGTTQVGGTGLGLTLVKHVVDVHGAAIEVESTPGRGSTFTLRFPLEAAP